MIQWAEIDTLIRYRKSPAVTVTMACNLPGPAVRQDSIRLDDLVARVAASLAARRVRDAGEILAPARSLIGDAPLLAGRPPGSGPVPGTRFQQGAGTRRADRRDRLLRRALPYFGPAAAAGAHRPPLLRPGAERRAGGPVPRRARRHGADAGQAAPRRRCRRRTEHLSTDGSGGRRLGRTGGTGRPGAGAPVPKTCARANSSII